MFGYIAPVKDDLSINDFEIFNSYYCGLCFAIKKKFGNIPRLALSYDSTFFAVLLDSISSDESISSSKSCIKHPLTQKKHIASNSALDFASDLNIALLYFKVLDDIYDERTFKSISLKKIIKPYYDKIQNSKLKSIFETNLNILHEYEHSESFESIDRICHPFSNLIGEVLKNCPFKVNDESTKTRELLYEFGYSFGKWIYLIDALEDLKQDIPKDRFNPINKIYNKASLPYNEFINNIKSQMDFFLITLASNCSDTLKKLPIRRNKDIIYNVVNLGLVDKYMHIFSNL